MATGSFHARTWSLAREGGSWSGHEETRKNAKWKAVVIIYFSKSRQFRCETECHESAFAGGRVTGCFRPETLGPVLLKIQGKYNGKGRNSLISLIAVILFSMKTINSEQ